MKRKSSYDTLIAKPQNIITLSELKEKLISSTS